MSEGQIAVPKFLRAQRSEAPSKEGTRSSSPGSEVGTIKFFDENKGFGFIQTGLPGQKDVYIHRTDLKASRQGAPVEGQRVLYDVGLDRKGGLKAINITLLEIPQKPKNSRK